MAPSRCASLSYAAALPRTSGEHEPPRSGPWPWARADTHTRSGSQRAGSVAAVSARQSAEQVVGSEEEEEQQQRSAILLASLRPDLSLSPLPHWASNLHEVAAAIITPEYNAPVILTELPVRQEPNILLARSGQFGEIFVEIF